jgi:hypothetical protein
MSNRTRIRETERAARNLIARAAYMEKRARRARVDSAEHTQLHAIAQEFRSSAELLLTEISELCRHATAH